MIPSRFRVCIDVDIQVAPDRTVDRDPPGLLARTASAHRPAPSVLPATPETPARPDFPGRAAIPALPAPTERVDSATTAPFPEPHPDTKPTLCPFPTSAIYPSVQSLYGSEELTIAIELSLLDHFVDIAIDQQLFRRKLAFTSFNHLESSGHRLNSQYPAGCNASQNKALLDRRFSRRFELTSNSLALFRMHTRLCL